MPLSLPAIPRLPFAIVVAGAAARVALALGTDIYADEAYYWTWSQRLDWSYFDHPPLIAWLIAPLGIRLTALACGLGTVAAVWGFARDVYGDEQAAWRAAALWSVVPVGVLASVFANPDTPLLLCWTLALWALHRERWWLAGLFCGLALLSKYSAVLLGLAFAIAAVRARRIPAGAWLTLSLAALLFLPVVLWNASHSWVGFAFQLKHGLGGRGGWPALGEYLGGQLLMGGPVLFPFALSWGIRGPRAQFLLRAATLLPLAVFGFAAWRTRGEANWPAAAYLAACVGLAGAPPFWRRGALGSGTAIVVLGTLHLLVPWIPSTRDVPLERTHGWAILGKLSEEPARPAVFTGSYQLSSEVAYYAGLPTDTVEGRFSQYDLWPPLDLAPGTQALWLSTGAPPPDALAARYERARGPELLVSGYRGRELHRFHLWRLEARRP